jgi:hypothetical protein
MLRIKQPSILIIRAYPQFALRQITFPVASPEIPDGERDDLLNVFMGQPLNIINSAIQYGKWRISRIRRRLDLDG